MIHGGKRPGAGRPKGQGKFGEPTKPIRVPESMVAQVLEYVESKGYEIPMYTSRVAAGFPSPADEHVSERLDLNRFLIRHPSSTFLVRASGDSMINAGIHSGDVLVVDRSLEISDGKIVIAAVDGELTVKRYSKKNGRIQLLPENPKYEPIALDDESELHMWGVVTNVIHRVA